MPLNHNFFARVFHFIEDGRNFLYELIKLETLTICAHCISYFPFSLVVSHMPTRFTEVEYSCLRTYSPRHL